MKYELYRDSKKEYRWRLIATNSKIIAVSSEGYINKADCEHAIDLVKSSGSSQTVDRTEKTKA